MEIRFHHLPEIPSTNSWALENGSDLDRDQLTCVYTDHQTGGRGRGKRQWLSPANQNITASFCFFLPKLRQDVGNLSQVMALSARWLMRELDLRAQVHWPNDVQIEGNKIAGILTETTPIEGKILVVVGIGLNVNMSQEELDKIDKPSTSLLVSTGETLDRMELLQKLCIRFERDLSLFLRAGFSPFFQDYVSSMTLAKGKAVKINDFKEVWEGVFDSLNPDGSVNIQLPLNEVRSVLAGEIL